MKKAPVTLFLSSLALAAAVTGCSKSSDTGAAAKSEAKTVLEYASTKDVRDINPHLYLGEMAAQAMVFDSLVRVLPGGKIVPALAESWEISPDGRVYTFHLRPGVRYTDGAPFDAASVKMNIDAILENKSRHAWLDLINEIESNEAVDTLTWRLTLRHPYFPTLIELGVPRPFRFISPRCMKNGSTKDGVTCLAGTGPWVLAEHKRDQYALFKVNPDYYGDKPAIPAVRWNVLPDPQTMLMALEKGGIDLIYGNDGDQLTSEAFDKLRADPKFSVHLSDPIASRAVLVNTAAPLTKDLALREALSYAVNREAVIKGVLNGMEEPAVTLFARSVPYCDVDLKTRPYNPERAKEILESNGWKTGGDGIRVKDGRRCTLAFYFNTQNTQEKRIALAVQADLAAMGIDVQVIGEEKQMFLDRQRTGKFDLQYALSWGAPYDPQSYLSSWRTPAHADFRAQEGLPDKKEIDKTIGLLMTEADQARRRAMVAGIITRMADEAVYIPISFARIKAVSRANIEGVGFAASQYEIPFEGMRFADHAKKSGQTK